MYNTHYKETLQNWKTIQKSLTEKECNVVTSKFKIEYNNYAHCDLWLRVYEELGYVFIYNNIPTWYYRQNTDSMHLYFLYIELSQPSPKLIQERSFFQKPMLRYCLPFYLFFIFVQFSRLY